MDRIDEILLQWYSWSNSYQPVRGYGKCDPACRMFQISRQWMDYDDLDHEVERNLKAAIGRTVEPFILELDIRYRLAINTAMRNFEAGADIWVNPRHPDTQEEDYQCAKDILCPKLANAGLVEKRACIAA